MEPNLWPEALLWHYCVAALAFAVLGALGHVMRGMINLYPDRLTDNQTVDLILSDGYDLKDWLFGTEYDDYGYYRGDSLKNLRIAVSLAVAGGLAAMLLVPGLSSAIGHGIDVTVQWLGERIAGRLAAPVEWI